MKPIHVATSHLESPAPPVMHCMERYQQAEQSFAELSSAENVVFDGDMSWDDSTDLPFPLPDGWVDAWTEIGSISPDLMCDGTRDGVAIRHLRDMAYRSILFGDQIEEHYRDMIYRAPRKRSDRLVCKLKDYRLENVELIGGGLSVRGYLSDGTELEFVPGYHCGLVLAIVPDDPAAQLEGCQEPDDHSLSQAN